MERNGLHVLTACGGALVGAWLIGGAYGHLLAVFPLIDSDEHSDAFALLRPGLMLGFAGLFNMVMCKWLWHGSTRALNAALVLNASVLFYLLYLLWRGVPGHPVAAFTAIVASFLLLLAATRYGLIWPTKPSNEGGQKRGEGI